MFSNYGFKIRQQSWYTDQRVTGFDFLNLPVKLHVYTFMSYELILWLDLRVSFCIQVTSYSLLHDLRVNFCMGVKIYC